MNNILLTLKVDLEERSYPIYIGENLLTSDVFSRHLLSSQVLIVTNSTVANLYLPLLEQTFKNFQCDEIILPDGEQYKTLETVNKVFDVLISNKHHRNTTLIALGGGVIGDITGFAAACYQRGVNFIQVPTTLLAQVDASIGGKTAVNHPQGKNMIGAFHQPRAVIIDVTTLKTLPEREFCSGLAEIIKAALLGSEDFFYWLEKNLSKILNKETKSLIYAIEQACAIKMKIVMADEKESGLRSLLNLGHTFAHAIEHSMGYGVWLHGEAVAVGLILAAEVSKRLGWLDEDAFLRIKNVLTNAKLPITLPSSISVNQLVDDMYLDKKIENGLLRLILLKAIGHAVLVNDIDMQLLQTTIAESIPLS